MQTILFFGDSLTAGYGLEDPKHDSYPGLIQKKIETANLSYEVINAGISGDTSASGLARLDYWLKKPVDVFVLELGINDVMRGVAPAITATNLQAIITRVRSKHAGVKVVLMGMELPAFLPRMFIDEFKLIFRKLVDKNSITLVPFFLDGVAGQPRLNLSDGLHPSSEGYKVIANNVWPVLKPLLQ
ncbi:arylesterase [soil metagenome]